MLRGVTSTNDCRGEADTNGNLCTITGGACDGNLRRGAGSLVIWLSGALKPRNGIFAGAVTCVVGCTWLDLGDVENVGVGVSGCTRVSDRSARS